MNVQLLTVLVEQGLVVADQTEAGLVVELVVLLYQHHLLHLLHLPYYHLNLPNYCPHQYWLLAGY
jgi:hypothetical protein